jgi:hypothetical protein
MLYNRHSYREAAEHFFTARAAFQQARNAYGEALAESISPSSASGKLISKSARGPLRQALALSQRIGALSVGLLGLCAAAEMHRRGGRERRAAQLLGLIRNHELARDDADVQRESTFTLERLTLPNPERLLASGSLLELNEVIRDEQAAL